MGLTSTIKAGVAAGFAAAGDVKVSATFTEVTGTTYDPEAGTNAEETTDYAGIEGFRRQYTVREIEAGIAQAGDIRFVAQADDLDFDPDTIDRVTIDGTVYQVQEFQPDPAGATIVFRLRA
jgi:hypothetical protein